MTKRTTKQARFFCMPGELQALLDPIFSRNGAQLCVAIARGGRYQFRNAVIPDDLNAVDPQFYAHVSMLPRVSDLSSLANYVQIWFPTLRDKRLRMGRIAISIDDSRPSEDHRKIQEILYREIYSAIVKNFRRGVLGRNSRTGGEHFYADIFVSEQAVLAYFDGGVSLASLMGDGFVSYHV